MTEYKPIRLLTRKNSEGGLSPYRLVDVADNEIKEVNEYLDTLAVRGLSEKTMRIYAYDLLNFWTWLTGAKTEFKDITRKSMLDYIRYQRQISSPASVTINHRLITVKCLYQHHFDRRIPISLDSKGESATYFSPRSGYRRLGWMHPIRGRQLSTKVKVPSRIVVPLKQQEVSDFFGSLDTWRDIAITGLMLFCGLRCKEVIGLKLNDISIYEEQFRVLGKGNKERLVPLPKNLLETVNKYIKLERPKTESPYLFIVLKGPHRGNQLTPAGVRTIFRYHRKISGISHANPHRFRHTFGADMTRAGVSVPALMRLMGHSQVQTTMRYVNLFAEDIRDEFNRAMAKLQSKEILNGAEKGF